MSYGVMASKSVHASVELTAGVGGVTSDDSLDGFQSVWGDAFVPGRLTLTRHHLSFIPRRAGRGVAMFQVTLRDVRETTATGGRFSQVLLLRTPAHLVRIRTSGAEQLADQVAQLAAGPRRGAVRRPGSLRH